MTGFRLFLAFPAIIMSGMLAGGGSVSSGGRGFSSGGVTGVASVLSWFSAMVRGRSPRGLRDFSAWALAYTAQFYAYLFLSPTATRTRTRSSSWAASSSRRTRRADRRS